VMRSIYDRFFYFRTALPEGPKTASFGPLC
jgi:hypothetical protein